MNNQNLLRGLTLMVVALGFGLQSLRYQMGNFTRPGPGLFPLMISGIVALLGLAIALRSRFVDPEPVDFDLRNIALVTLALCGMALISHYLNMILGIIFLVFCSSLAGGSFKLARCIKVSAGLIVVAFAFDRLLGLRLPLY